MNWNANASPVASCQSAEQPNWDTLIPGPLGLEAFIGTTGLMHGPPQPALAKVHNPNHNAQQTYIWQHSTNQPQNLATIGGLGTSGATRLQ